MTALLYDDPLFVHLHIPKCGGTSIRGLMGQGRAKRAFGHIPPRWQGAPVLAVVREPVARFLSAVNLFRLGAPDVDDFFATPRLPGLTIAKALDILGDERLAFDRSARSPEANLRHHLIAQTHPFNCLHLATHRIRLERMAQDWPALAQSLGLDPQISDQRTTRTLQGALKRADISADEMARLRALLADDFRLLGYDANGGFASADVPPLPTPEDGGIWPLWPAYFSDLHQKDDAPELALPAADAPLAPLAAAPVPRPAGGTWLGRHENLVDHFHGLQPEFATLSRICHLMACTIVVIRRAPDCAPAQQLFFRLLAEQGDILAEQLNTRWLTSVCDTLMEIGPSPECRALALAGSFLANTAKLYETERRVYSATQSHPPARRLAQGGQLFDGVMAFGARQGDMITNMITRAEAQLTQDNPATPIVAALLHRLFSHDTAYRRFAEMADAPVPPLADEAELQDLKAALAVIDALPRGRA